MSPFVVLAVVLVFGFLVTFHEFGHYLVAKLNGVRVLEFNVGFGPPLLRATWGETTYGLRAVPLGGYVRLAGMDDGETGPKSFNQKPVWRRLSIIVAGSMANLVLPIAIFFFVYVQQSGGPVTAQAIVKGLPADRAGLQPGQQLIAVNGRPIRSVFNLRDEVNASKGRPVTLRSAAPGKQPSDVVITPVQQNGRWLIGVSPGGGAIDAIRGFGDSVLQDAQFIGGTLAGFYQLFTGGIRGGLGGSCGPSGPIGIVRATAAAASAGWLSLLYFAAFLSVNLGILNLLPLPALDGGRLAFLIVEGIRRRAIDPLKEQRVHYAGLLVLLTLVVFISYNDIVRLSTPFGALLSQCGG
ncbi:MAG TPA: M50 family metallopeptidase [Candidatus Dormibacteraeota bacterium]|nr:M50 family metallopeptidase [Candidatus Dormibacteraeota bacterium]